MSTQLASLIRDVSIIFGTLAVIAGGYYAYTKNVRDDHNQALAEASTTIIMLEKQNELLEKQNEHLEEQRKQSTEAWQKRETEWLKVEAKLEKRINDIERDYRTLVLTVTSMGFCANAGTCDNYNPGDRRKHSIPSGGGTDG